MKEEVLELLRDQTLSPAEKYDKAKALYRKSDGHSIPANNYYNRAGYTPNLLKNICYDLQKLHKISGADLSTKAVAQMKVIGAGVLNGKLIELLNEADDDLKVAFVLGMDHPEFDNAPEELQKRFEDVANAFLKENEEFFKEHGESLNGEEGKKLLKECIGEIKLPEDVQSFLNEYNRPKDVEGFVAKMSQVEGEGLKLRTEFPFLDEDDCPDKLKILVADRISAWKKYCALHEQLLKFADGEEEKVLTDAELYEVAKTAIDKYQLNQEIWEELTHYKEYKEILGKHAIFADEELQKKVDALTDLKAATRLKTLKTYVSRDSKKLKSAKTDASKAKIQEKIDGWKAEQTLLEKKLEGKE